MSILCVIVHVLCVYASKLLSGFFWHFWDNGLAFFGEDRLASLLCSLARFDLANRGARQPVQPHTFARLLVFDETLAQPHFAVVNCDDAVMSVFYSPFSTRSQNFAVTNSCVAALSLFSSDILTWSADSLYSVKWHIKWGGTCRKICILCQQILPKRWFGNMNITSNCGVTKTAHIRKKITTICHGMKAPMKIFCVRHCLHPIEWKELVLKITCKFDSTVVYLSLCWW